MKILIATPTAGGLVTTAYTHSLVGACQVFAQRGIDFDHGVFDSADVAMARNFFANTLIRSQDFTHLLFIDSDMLITKPALTRLIDWQAAMAGLIYPERQIDLAAYRNAVLDGHDHQNAEAIAMRFVVKFLDDQIQVRDGFCKVEGIGFGCVLVARTLLERLIADGIAEELVSNHLTRQGLSGTLYDFFGPIDGPHGERLSEDFSFCARVRKAGQDVWALVDAEVGHAGRYTYKSNYLRFLEANSAPS